MYDLNNNRQPKPSRMGDQTKLLYCIISMIIHTKRKRVKQTETPWIRLLPKYERICKLDKTKYVPFLNELNEE